ncbi:DUF4097 family beta strand repeat-containing protein [Nonomuraea sp. SYSU D8015]|uniref:DUF4097 family beta strand repeat-containing protein n=1 Tax=Nonomuraea sp. SYSU D8015 TaxID=2593644 RepID=UPI001CB6E7F6|nr:DUF4097 family beta strand repeat-containing protein [Nonomuraea sp. SYSU D8015]
MSFTAADIRISATQRTDTTVEVRPADPADATDVAAAERARVTYAGGRLTVKDRSSIRSLPGRVAVTVELPSGSALDISLRDGLLNGQGRLGEVRAHVSRGHIHLARTGESRLSTDDGDITVATSGGPAALTTAHGQIKVGESIGATVIGNGAGNVTVDRAEDGLRVTVEQGAVKVGAMARGRADLDVAHVTQGDILLHRVTSWLTYSATPTLHLYEWRSTHDQDPPHHHRLPARRRSRRDRKRVVGGGRRPRRPPHRRPRPAPAGA